MELTKHCVYTWATRVIFVVVVLTQVVTLNQYIVRYEGKSSFQAFILLYIPSLTLWVKGQCRNDRSRFVAVGVWLLYVIPLGVETGWILRRLIAGKIDENSLLDSGFLKYVLSLASVVFLILEAEGRLDVQVNTSHTWILVVDVLDSVDLLGVLLDGNSSTSLPSSVRNAIMSFSLISMLAMTFALTETWTSLTRSREGDAEPLSKVVVVYLLIQTLLINFPFLVIRLVLHYRHEQDSSVFAFKNFLMILLHLGDICFNCCYKAACFSGFAAESSSRGRSTQPSVGDTDESLSTVSSGRRQIDVTRRTDPNGRLIRPHDILTEAQFV